MPRVSLLSTLAVFVLFGKRRLRATFVATAGPLGLEFHEARRLDGLGSLRGHSRGFEVFVEPEPFGHYSGSA